LARGERTELDAVLFLRERGDRLLLRRFETPYAELDILAMKPNGRLLICEVKSSFWPEDRALGLGFRQRARLSKAAFWIGCETGRDVEVSLLGPSTRRGQFLEIPIF
jgi:Holliday junction resolvase-like predicted endonuclease